MKTIIAPFLVLDAWILGKVEKFAHKFQRITGKTSVFCAIACLVVIAGIFLWRVVALGEIFYLLLCGIFFVWAMMSYRPIKTLSEWRISRGYSNPDKIESLSIMVRLFFIAFVFLRTIYGDGHLDVPTMFWALYVYFMACDPLPPCKSRAWEWVKGLFSA